MSEIERPIIKEDDLGEPSAYAETLGHGNAVKAGIISDGEPQKTVIQPLDMGNFTPYDGTTPFDEVSGKETVEEELQERPELEDFASEFAPADGGPDKEWDAWKEKEARLEAPEVEQARKEILDDAVQKEKNDPEIEKATLAELKFASEAIKESQADEIDSKTR